MDIGPHHHMHQMQMHQSRSLVNDINDLDDEIAGIGVGIGGGGGSVTTTNSTNNISFANAAAASRRPLMGAGSGGSVGVPMSNSHDTFRQNEHNLAMMQDIVIEQILSGDLHSNSFHSHSSANTNPSSNRSNADGHPGSERGGSSHMMLSNNSISNSSTGSKFSRFASTKIPLVSKIMAPYRDNPTSASNRNGRGMVDDSQSDEYNRHHFPPRGGGTIDLNHIEMIEEINLHEDHDQLPDVESYKASVYHRSTNKNSSPWYGSRNRIRNVLTVVSGICICIFFTLLGVLIGRRNHSTANDYGVLPPTTPTTPQGTNTLLDGYVEPEDRYAA
jgi:hypothetical protein